MSPWQVSLVGVVALNLPNTANVCLYVAKLANTHSASTRCDIARASSTAARQQ